LDTLFETLDDTQMWAVFCLNPNDSQLPNQLEGRSVKGQVRSYGLSEVAKRNGTVFEAGMTPEEFGDRYKDTLVAAGATEGDIRDMIQGLSGALGLKDNDVVLGQQKVGLFFFSDIIVLDANRALGLLISSCFPQSRESVTLSRCGRAEKRSSYRSRRRW